MVIFILGGLGVTKGYINEEALSRQKFIAHPFREGEILYQTGDLGKYHLDGNLECLGRSDDQVKVRGYRIELGEVENAVLELDYIFEAAAKRDGDQILLFISIKKEFGYESVNLNSLKSHLKIKLPPYMVAHRIYIVENIPKTLNNKIDRKKLHSQLAINVEQKEIHTQLISPIEVEVLNIWKKYLKREDINLDDDFFSLGGHSLLAVELFTYLSEAYKLELPLFAIFEKNKVRSLAQYIAEKLRVSEIGENAQHLKKINEINPLGNNEDISLIVTLHKGESSHNPIFCFYGVGGNVLNYYPLIKSVGDHPFYGVQSKAVFTNELVEQSIMEMAHEYVDEILKFSHSGAYVLAGGSMGGVLAIEVANLLKSHGKEIKNIIMFDTFGPEVIKVLNHQSLYRRIKKWFFKKIIILFDTSIVENRYQRIEKNHYNALNSHQISQYEGNITLIRSPK